MTYFSILRDKQYFECAQCGDSAVQSIVTCNDETKLKSRTAFFDIQSLCQRHFNAQINRENFVSLRFMIKLMKKYQLAKVASCVKIKLTKEFLLQQIGVE